MAQPTLSDTKVKASNHFKTAKRAYPKINESVQLTIARAAIQAEWDAIQANNLKEFSEQLWSDLSELGYDIENAKSVIITKEGDITLKGTRPRKGRWTDDHYSEFIGERGVGCSDRHISGEDSADSSPRQAWQPVLAVLLALSLMDL